jgi:molybdopterin-guanine dinucleotide biosynthesis protein B
VLVEGFKRERHPKLEVYRQAVGKSALHLTDDRIVGVASDQRLPNARVPVLELHDIGAVGTFILARAEPMAQVLAALERPPGTP